MNPVDSHYADDPLDRDASNAGQIDVTLSMTGNETSADRRTVCFKIRFDRESRFVTFPSMEIGDVVRKVDGERDREFERCTSNGFRACMARWTSTVTTTCCPASLDAMTRRRCA